MKEQALSNQQAAIVNLDHYLRVSKLFEKTARKYADRQTSHLAPQMRMLERENIQQQAQAAFHDFYRANSPKKLQLVKDQWGQEGEVFQSMLGQMSEKIDKIHHKTMKRETEHSTWEGLVMMYKFPRSLQKSPPYQKESLLREAGLSQEEAKTARKNIVKSSVYHAATLGSSTLLTFAAGAYVARFYPFLEHLSSAQSKDVLIGTYLLNYATLGINFFKQLKLVKNKNIRASFNVLLTGGQYLAEILSPKKKIKQSLWALTPPVGWLALGEFIAFALMYLHPSLPSAVTTKNIIASAYNTAESVTASIWNKRSKGPDKQEV